MVSSSMNTQIQVNVEKILRIALLGVQRASMFMGLGVNAALNKELTEYQLTGISQIQLLSSELSSDQLARAKEEFKLWIEANGFRELIETFHVFLDAVNLACLNFRFGMKEIAIDELKADQAKFAKQGFPNKLNLLRQKYGIEAKHADHLLSLNGARNVLTHRLSVVQQKDLNSKEVMVVSWLGADILIEESNGTRHHIEEVIEKGKSFPETTHLLMQFKKRNREFRVGERLALSSKDLAEVCWFMSREARSFTASLIEFAKRVGIKIHKENSELGTN